MGQGEDIVERMDLRGARPSRVSVVGSTGTGKTTFARELAAILGARHVELDAMFWGPDWSHLEPEEFRERIGPVISAASWVIDGNYGGAGVRELVWAQADTIIWLDFSLAVIFARLWSRTMARIRDGKELWPGTGNRETIRNAFLSRDSLFLWAAKTYRRRKRNYTALFGIAEHAHLVKLRFRSPAEADRWLQAERERAAARI